MTKSYLLKHKKFYNRTKKLDYKELESKIT